MPLRQKMLIRIEPWTPAELPNTYAFINMNRGSYYNILEDIWKEHADKIN